jgi:IPT/TIG domain
MLRRVGLLAALTALLVPAIAGTAPADAAKRKKKRSPVVTSISPKNVFVGEKLTIRGRHFRRGVNKNTVAFKRKGAKVMFVKADKGTSKMLSVTLPKRLEKILVVENGTPVPTRLQVRVLSSRFGKRFTKLSKSPVVGPEKPPAPPKPKEVDPNGDCDGDKVLNRNDSDDDNDLLADDLEISMKLDPCNADHDADGVSDGYEFASAQDLNDDEITNVPYPRKLPYPNPLDGTDAGTDHDGDALTLKDEFDLWQFVGQRWLEPLSYSAGEQYSWFAGGGAGPRTPSLAADGYDKQTAFMQWAWGTGYGMVALATVGGNTVPDDIGHEDWFGTRTPYDIRDMDRDGFEPHEATYYDNGNGLLNDAERDEDADGLSNWAETVGCMTRKYWDELFDGETPYPLQYGAVRLDDPDSDGDGVRDGADDQDHDDVPNMMECSRILASGMPEDPADLETPPAGRPWKGFVNPFNPCMPHTKSRTCNRIVSISSPWAPFNADESENYYLIRD